MKQTAIEWLIEQIKDDQFNKVKTNLEWSKIFEQAKEMEREQIVDAYFKGSQSENAKDKNPEFFYTINYKPFYPEK
jgi:hypothetical protein